MIVDTSALLAYFDAQEPQHDLVASAINDAEPPLVVSPYVIAEWTISCAPDTDPPPSTPCSPNWRGARGNWR